MRRTLMRAHRKTLGRTLRGGLCGALLACIVLVAACAETPRAMTWEAIGPPGVYTPVLAIAFDPASPNKMMAGSFEAPVLYESNDGGVTWSPSPTGAAWPPPTYALRFHGSPGRVIAGASDGIWLSDDSGRTWKRAPGTPSVPMYALAGDRSGVLFAGGADPRPYASRDGGQTWAPLAPVPAGTAVLSLAASPDGGWLLAGADGGGLFQSYDGGRSWRDTGVGPTYVAGVWVLNVGAREGEAALARGRGVTVHSDDRGRTWQVLPEAWQGRFDAALPVSGAGGVLLATNQGLIYRSQDLARWSPWGAGFGRRGAVHALVSDPGAPERIFAATETGLYRSGDGGLHWEKVLDGPGMPSANAFLTGREDRLLVAGAGGVHASSDDGASWQSSSAGLPPSSVLALTASPAAPGRLYAGLDGDGLYLSRDDGMTWERSGWTEGGVPEIVTHPRDPGWVLIRVAFQRVYLSLDGGASFAPRWDGMTLQTEVTSLALDPDDPDLVFAGATDGLYRSTDGANRWQRVSGDLDGQTVFATAKLRGGRLAWLAGTTKGIYRSVDAGISWKRIWPGERDVTVTALAIDPNTPGRVYAGSKSDGVLVSADGGRSWDGIGSGLDAPDVKALHLLPDGRELLAATSAGALKVRVR